MKNDETIDDLRAQVARLDATLDLALQRESLAVATLHDRKAALIRAEVDHGGALRERRKVELERMTLGNRLHLLECPSCSAPVHRHPIN